VLVCLTKSDFAKQALPGRMVRLLGSASELGTLWCWDTPSR
jgi:hypothetical protein